MSTALTSPVFQPIPAQLDPTVDGLSGAVGNLAQNAGSLRAWIKIGPNATDWQPFPGVCWFRTPRIDFTQTGDGIWIPAMPGLVAFDIGCPAQIIYSAIGATVGPTMSAGNNESLDNVLPAMPTVLDALAGATVPTRLLCAMMDPPAIHGALLDLTTAVVIHVTAGASGGPLAGYVAAPFAVMPFPT